MIIKTERLGLRPFVESDAELLIKEKVMLLKRRTHSWTVCSIKKMPEEFMLMWKIIVYQASICAKKLGMRKEGEFKEFVFFVNNPDGSPCYENTFQYAVLKKEWR